MNRPTDTPVLVRLYYRVNPGDSDPASSLQIPVLITNLLNTAQKIPVADDHTATAVFTHIGQPTLGIHHQGSHRNHSLWVLHGSAASPSHDRRISRTRQKLSETTHAEAPMERCTEIKDAAMP